MTKFAKYFEKSFSANKVFKKAINSTSYRF